jgi:uncharacterized repeat protein (TIGR04076 family)
MPQVKITVVKIAAYTDLIESHVDTERFPQDAGPCPLWKEGQEFIIKGSWPTKPDGFCDWAWTDIQRDVTMILLGADLPWLKTPGVAIACCTDGLRPVSFKIERMEE